MWPASHRQTIPPSVYNDVGPVNFSEHLREVLFFSLKSFFCDQGSLLESLWNHFLIRPAIPEAASQLGQMTFTDVCTRPYFPRWTD